MIAREHANVPDPSETEGALLGDLIGSAAHDLGGIAAALALRVDALGTTVSAEDHRGLVSIAAEARTLARQLRQLRAPRGEEQLAPDSATTFARWWPLIERFGRAVAGRGIALDARMDDTPITAQQSHALTFATLALLRAPRDRGLAAGATVHIVSKSHGGQPALCLTARSADGTTIPMTADDGPWTRYASHAAARGGIDLRFTDGAATLVANA
ncbi:MAG: hypothetical protein IT361_03850 [Gemmatimonadaceae bacterium]|nr:hypothetical protein [Gemmatimonadaceae bacterium]